MMRITSPAFEHNAGIPEKYTCRGNNISPPLQWEVPPEGTRSIAVIAEDPDSSPRTFTHWILYNIAPRHTELPEDVPKEPVLSDGSRQGQNDFMGTGYGGPCPHEGEHRYIFRVYALDKVLDLDGTVDRDKLHEAITGHVLDHGDYQGLFKAGNM